MFGLGVPELIIVAIVLGVLGGMIILMNPKRIKNGTERRCLVCNYTGEMKTWLRNYNLPQFISLFLLFVYVIPGLVFIGWGWGKYKCPMCGTLAKNVPIDFKPSA